MPALAAIDSQLTIHEWHEELLPAASTVDSQLTIHEWEEEPRPTTDKLSANSKKVIESILVSLPSRPASHNLWSYSRKLPAIVARSSPAQRPVPAKVELDSDHEVDGQANFLL
jgi:hypothetical protein